MRTHSWWRTQGGKFILTAVHSGSEAVSAYIYGDKLYCDFDNLGSGETVTITLPGALKIIDARLRVKKGGEVATKTLTVKNGSDTVSSTLSMATDKGVVRATTIDTTYTSVAKAGTIVLTSSAHADGNALVVIDIEPN